MQWKIKYIIIFWLYRQDFISFTSIVGAPVGIASASFTLIFSVTTGIVRNLLNIARNKKKRHDKILMLAKSKLNSIETLISQALIDMEISHKEFITILKEKDKYEKMKDNLKVKMKKQRIKLWDWAAHVKDSSCKAMYKIKDLNDWIFLTFLTFRSSFNINCYAKYVSNWH